VLNRSFLLALGAACALSVTACSVPAGGQSAESTGGRIKVAMLLPPRSGLSPFSDDALKLSRFYNSY
jgi:peptide/nickel transport system substrate-binding protein